MKKEKRTAYEKKWSFSWTKKDRLVKFITFNLCNKKKDKAHNLHHV